MQLEDVERLEAGVAKCTAAIREFAEREQRGDWRTIKESKEARKRAQSALRAMQGAGGEYLPALLALAREALERRRDGAPRPVTAAESAVLRKALLAGSAIVHEGERREETPDA